MSEAVKIGFVCGQTGTAHAAEDRLRGKVQQVIERGSRCLLSLQAPEGYWLGELEADTTLESDYILYLHVLDRFDSQRVCKLANYIRRRQLPDGGWNICEGGPAELNATVKAYFALKLAGDPPGARHMVLACHRAHELGGLERTNSFTRLYLALVGAVGWEMVPAIPPELMLLPTWSYVNIYEMSSWTRAILVPLMILYACKPQWFLPSGFNVDELFCDPLRKTAALEWDQKLFAARNFFLIVDRLFKVYERFQWTSLRQRALGRATRWLLDHLERSDGLGAIYPAMMNAVFALLALGYSVDDPLMARQIRELARFEIEEGDTLRLQPCLSPVWDTAIAMVALQEAGLPTDHPALIRATRWLLERQVLGPGDWQVKNRSAEPGGWAFQFRNDFYPDVDDTAFVLMALRPVAYPNKPGLEQAIGRGLAWLISMQNQDGGWGAFDHNNDRTLLTRIPFADHNAMIDPSTADVTGRVVECLGQFGWRGSHPVIERAVSFLRRDQSPEGAWYGRWGVNYVYGTGGVLRALANVGLTHTDHCHRAAAWLRAVQNDDGGFGESCVSYNDQYLKGRGESTPSQTAWGLTGLLAVTEATDPAVTRAVQYLIERQNPDGSWDEQPFTGTGFPCVFYLKYHLYRNYFPLYALARYRNLVQSSSPSEQMRASPQQLKGQERARRDL
ncbi:MAG: squalene--hopene cyclase [Acidobacteria bacterium]|nr:squalene--hopene cyclase [Acidobacteriota bacterium]